MTNQETDLFTTSNVTEEPVVKPSFQWDFGASVSGGYLFPCSPFALDASWTYYHAHLKEKKSTFGDIQFGPPYALFASRSVPISDRLVPRTIETIMPTAALLEKPIHSSFNGYEVHEMADLVLTNKKYQGKNIVICWNHSSIHDLINAFGYALPFTCSAPNKKYPDCRFDLTFVMTFPAPQPLSSQPIPYATVYFQQLLFGDLTCEEVCSQLNCTCSYPPALPPEACSCNSPATCSLICSVLCSSVGLGDD